MQLRQHVQSFIKHVVTAGENFFDKLLIHVWKYLQQVDEIDRVLLGPISIEECALWSPLLGCIKNWLSRSSTDMPTPCARRAANKNLSIRCVFVIKIVMKV
jgi:hypothetical protein